MIGYMKPQKGAFTKEQRSVYQSIYCGLCRHLKYGYGITGTFAISYEIVDLLLMIESILPCESTTLKMSCSLTPFVWKNMKGINEYIYSKAAEISIIIAGLEIQDNIQDDNHMHDKLLQIITKSKVEKARNNSGDNAFLLEREYSSYMLLEKKSYKNNTGFGDVVDQCGNITKVIGAILTEKLNDDVGGIITGLMKIWGEWIYLMDAVEDYEDDIKNKRFNPWSLSDAPIDRERCLTDLENKSKSLLEKLPVRRYESILQSLYNKQLPMKRAQLFQK